MIFLEIDARIRVLTSRDQLAEIDRLDDEPALAGVGQQLAGQVGGPLAGRAGRPSGDRPPARLPAPMARRARPALPMMPVSRLLKSWAMPPARTPMLSSFCACCSASSFSRCVASICFCSVRSRTTITAPTTVLSDMMGAAEELMGTRLPSL